MLNERIRAEVSWWPLILHLEKYLTLMPRVIETTHGMLLFRKMPRTQSKGLIIMFIKSASGRDEDMDIKIQYPTGSGNRYRY